MYNPVMTAEIASPTQEPIAQVSGAPFDELPQDLYIPPDALEVVLESFEGPLDLLLYLIKRQNLDILHIPVADITNQYISYINLMTEMRFELAAEYLVMAATLAEIKSRMLLPRQTSEEEEGEDPRAELIRRLQEYEQFKEGAENLDTIPRLERDIFLGEIDVPYKEVHKPLPDVDLRELLLSLHDVLRRADMYSNHQVEMEPLSVRERMSRLIDQLDDKFVPFSQLFDHEEGRAGVVVSFLAVLELLKLHLLDIAQSGPYAPIHVRAAQQDGSSEFTGGQQSLLGADNYGGAA